MRYIITFAVIIILFSQCRPKVEVYPTGSFDTLGIQWMTIERNNVIYYFQGTGAEGASIYTDLHEEAYETLVPVFNPVLPGKMRFFVWTDWVQAEQLLNYFPGFAIPAKCVCHVRANQTLGHEMVHILSYWAGGIEPTTYSKFIDEGVAVAFDLEENDKLQDAKEAATAYQLKTIRDLWTLGNSSAPDDLLYPVGGAFIEYLYKRSSPGQFFELLKNQELQDGEKIYGKEQLDTFIADFDKQLGL